MGKGYRNKVRAVDFYCTDKDRKQAYQQRATPGGWNQPVKPEHDNKLPRSFHKIKFITGDEQHQPKKKKPKAEEAEQPKSNKKKQTKEETKDGPRVLKPGEKYEFKTEIREGESFGAFRNRLAKERDMVLFAQAQKLNPMSTKQKDHLKKRKEREKLRKQEKEARAEEEARADFRGPEKIPFGEVADRPPIFKNRPKVAAPPPGIGVLAEFLQKKQAAEEDPEETRKLEALQRHKLVQARKEEMLREKSQQAYKDAKKRKLSTTGSG